MLPRGHKVLELFDPPYENWRERALTLDEQNEYFRTHGTVPPRHIQEELLETLTCGIDATVFMLRRQTDAKLNSFLTDRIDDSTAYKEWRQSMPRRTPKPLVDYQKSFSNCDLLAADAEIRKISFFLPVGQTLFHGGLWKGLADSVVTTEPFSTSLLPCVALRNAEHKGKAYHAGEVHLMTLSVKSPNVCAYVYRKDGTFLGHEHEVLLAAGSRLTVTNRILVRQDYPAALSPENIKLITGVALEVDVT